MPLLHPRGEAAIKGGRRPSAIWKALWASDIKGRERLEAASLDSAAPEQRTPGPRQLTCSSGSLLRFLRPTLSTSVTGLLLSLGLLQAERGKAREGERPPTEASQCQSTPMWAGTWMHSKGSTLPSELPGHP